MFSYNSSSDDISALLPESFAYFAVLRLWGASWWNLVVISSRLNRDQHHHQYASYGHSMTPPPLSWDWWCFCNPPYPHFCFVLSTPLYFHLRLLHFSPCLLWFPFLLLLLSVKNIYSYLFTIQEFTLKHFHSEFPVYSFFRFLSFFLSAFSSTATVASLLGWGSCSWSETVLISSLNL